MAKEDLATLITKRIKRAQFGAKAQLNFLEDFANLVEDGIPPNRAIEMLSRSSSGIVLEVAQSLGKSISKGKPLAEGMSEWFDFNVVEVIRIGEEGGALGETIKSAINMMAAHSSVYSAVLGAATYPSVVVVAGASIIVYLNDNVFSQFATIKSMDKWPAAGVRLVDTANLITHWWWLLFVIIAAMVIILRIIFKNYTGELRLHLDKFFPFNIYRKLAAAHVLETLGLLVSNGVVFKSALGIMQHQATPYLAMHLSKMEVLIGKGKGNIADVLDTGLIEDSDLMRLRILAEVKGFEHGLIRLGVRGTEDGIKTLKMLGKMLGGAIMVVGTILIIIAINGVFQTGMSMGEQ